MSSDDVFAIVHPSYCHIHVYVGLIHVIDRVLRPPNLLSESLTKTLNSTSFLFAALK